MKRRKFVGATLALSPYLLGHHGLIPEKSQESLDVLVLGGTHFLGPAIVNSLVSRQHNVTLFNRGITNPDLYPSLARIKGDRSTGLSSYKPLQSKSWDIVIDVWPEHAHMVEEATAALENRTSHYMFISSIAVYRDFQTVGLSESSPTVSTQIPKEKWSYAEEKCAAEDIVRSRFDNRHTILRPGAIKGWRDTALDLFYWCHQVITEKVVLCPGSGKDPIQFIDVKDVARFAVKAAEDNLKGTFNCLGPKEDAYLWSDFLNELKQITNSEAKLCWAQESFLARQKVYSFSDMPLWAPLSEDEGFMQISNQKMRDTGFVHSSIQNTIEDVVNWTQKNGFTPQDFGTEEIGIGLSKDRQRKLLNMLDCS